MENNYLTEKDISEADQKYAACKGDKQCQMQVVKDTNELSKQKNKELQENLHNINNEMAKQMREAVQNCGGDTQCQNAEYDRIRQEAQDKWDSYKQNSLDGQDWEKLATQYYPDDTRIQAIWEGIKDSPGKMVDSAGNVIAYIDKNTVGQIANDGWKFGQQIANIPGDWLDKEIPADSFETALNNLGSMTGHDVGEATFYTIAGNATAVLGGKAMQWVGGKWVEAKGPAVTAINNFIKDEKGSIPLNGSNSGKGSTISNDVLDNPRVGSGEKGQGSGNKVDLVSNKPVLDIDGQQISVQYPANTNKPLAMQEFPTIPKAHGFNDIIDNYAGYATTTKLNNGATLHQLEGSLNGASGRFEWIVDPNLGGVSHRMFVPNGKINGVPSKP